MVQSTAKTVDEYLKELPEKRREELNIVRKTILAHLPKGYVEVMRWGMITYEVPLKHFSQTYNNEPLQYIGLAAQKNFFALYFMHINMNKTLRSWFISEWRKTNLKLKMGASCVRFDSTEDIPLELIGKAVAKVKMGEFIEFYKKVKKR